MHTRQKSAVAFEPSGAARRRPGARPSRRELSRGRAAQGASADRRAARLARRKVCICCNAILSSNVLLPDRQPQTSRFFSMHSSIATCFADCQTFGQSHSRLNG